MSTVALSTSSDFKTSMKCQGSYLLLKSFPSSFSFLRSTLNTFGLKSSSCFKATAVAVYKVKLIGPEGEEHEFEAPEGTYILDSAETAVLMPCRGMLYLCRSDGVRLGQPVGWILPR